MARKRGSLTSGEAEQIFSGLTHPEGGKADFHSLHSDDVRYLLDTAKEVGYRAPRNASGSRARSFYSHLQRRAKGPWKVTRLRKNPRDEITELNLFITNDGNLYRQMTTPIIKNLQRKKAKGTYNGTLALKAWLNLATEGAKRYAKEFGGTYHQMFSMADRRAVAGYLAHHYAEEINEGNVTVLKRNPRKKLPHGYFLYNVGDRIELHPATDWWMRGARYGEVRKVNPPVVTVKLDKVKRLVKIHYDNVLKVISPAGSERIAENPRRRKRVVRKGTRMKVTRLRRNPVASFHICAHRSGGNMYYRHSTGSFIDSKTGSTAYKSRTLALRTARGLLTKLPSSISKLSIAR
jgi:hypothetical protein